MTTASVYSFDFFRYVVDYTVTETATNYKVVATLKDQCVFQGGGGGITKMSVHIVTSGSHSKSLYVQTSSSDKVSATLPKTVTDKTNVTSTSWTNVGNSCSCTFTVNKTHATQKITIGFTNTYNANASGSPQDMVVVDALSSSNQIMNSYTYKNFASKTVATLTVPALASYSVTYNANGGSGTTSSQTKWYGESLTLRTNSFTRTNYAFKRWNTNTTDTGTVYNAGASYTGNAALTLYAIWNRTVTYNANSGTGAPTAQTAIATSAITLSSTKPTRSGYKFMSWNTASDNSGTAYQPGGTYAANNPSVTLYAIWWKNPTVSTPTVTRCDSQGNSDICGGYVKVSVPWSIEASQLGVTQTAPSSFSISVTGNSQTFSDATVPSGTSGTREVILGGGSVKPDKAYTATVTVTDTNGTATSTASLAAESSYTAPSITNVAASLVDSVGTADVLGKYVRITANYAVYQTTVQSAASSLSASITHNASDTEAKQNLSASGTTTWTFGPYDYDDVDPHGGYNLGTISLSDRFNTTTVNIQLAATRYANPAITSISAYRVDMSEEEGVITFEESDDGTCLGLDLSWAVTETPSQTDPSSVIVVVRDMDAADALHEIVATRTFTPTGSEATFDIYPDSQQWPDDIVIGGELINTAHRYTVDAIVSDLYSNVVVSAKANRSDSVTVAYFTMDFLAGGHGVAFGKPCTTAELLDVGYGAQFEGEVYINSESITDGVTPSQTVFGNRLNFGDSNGEYLGSVFNRFRNDGVQMLRLAESRTVNDVQETNAIGLGLDPSNNAVVDLTHPAAWRSTLQVLPLAGGDMTGEIASKFSAGVSYIQGCAGNGTGLYMKKASTSSSTWNPAMTVQTKGQGGWSMGNYDGEELRFTYGTKANIDSNTNTTAHTMALYDSLLTVTNNVRLVHKSNYAAISFQGAKRTGDVIRFYGSTANADGDEIVIGNGGQVIVGSGESAVNLHTALAADVGTEQTYIISDNSIFLCTKANTIGNRVKWQFAANNYPTVYADCGAENGVVIGTSSNNGVTANTTIGQYYMRDKNGYWTLCLGNRTNASDNSIYGYIGVRNQKTDGTDVTNYIQAIVDKDGNRKYNVSDAGQFRSAISTHSRYTQLYNNTSGSNAAITLSATAANYTWLRIYFYGKSTASGSATKYDSVDVYSPNGKIVQLSCSGQGKSGDTAVIFFTKFVTISGTSVANTSYCSASIDTGGTTCAKNNEIYITRVDGWTN